MAEPYDPKADADLVIECTGRRYKAAKVYTVAAEYVEAAERLARWAAGDDGPADGAWLESIGFAKDRKYPRWSRYFDGGTPLTLWLNECSYLRWQYGDTGLPDSPARSQVLSLLAALGAAPAGESGR
jgi:hypothetical protein